MSGREVTGVVMAQLPGGLNQVELEGARRIAAHAAGTPVGNFVRLIVGDRVVVELAPRDPGRGRIVKKL